LTLRDTFRSRSDKALSGWGRFTARAFDQGRQLAMWPRGRKSNHAQSEDGQAMVEFAITFSILIGFVFAFMELCMMLYSYDMISECAREGTRYAIVHGASCLTPTNASCTVTAANVNSYVSGLGWANPGGHMIVATSYPDNNENPGSRVQVTVTYSFPIMLSWAPAGSISMQSSSQMYIIQ